MLSTLIVGGAVHGKLLASLVFFIVVRAVLAQNRAERIAGLARALMVGGAVQGAIGTALMALSAHLNYFILFRIVKSTGFPCQDFRDWG